MELEAAPRHPLGLNRFQPLPNCALPTHAQRVAAEELGLSDEAVEVRLARVQAVLPDLAEKLPAMRPALVAALVAAAEELGGRVLQLKEIFPGANVSRLAVRELQLVLGFDMARLAAIAAELAELFPRIDIDRCAEGRLHGLCRRERSAVEPSRSRPLPPRRLVEANPSVLDLKGLRLAMEEAQRIMPGIDIQRQMASDPQVIFSFQRGGWECFAAGGGGVRGRLTAAAAPALPAGSRMVPYDPARAEEDDDEYAAREWY